jgi:trehalose synthase-fused probable maltokinase
MSGRCLLESPSELERFVTLLPSQRWFAGKAKVIAGAEFRDVIDLSDDANSVGLGVVEVRFTDESSDLYLTPLPVPETSTNAATSSPTNPLWRRLLQRMLLDPTPLMTSRNGQLIGHATSALNRSLLANYSDSSLRESSAQQSNTSVSVGGEYFLKLFRRPQPGINPDAEIGVFLTECGDYQNSPSIAGTIEYIDSHNVSRCVAILSQQVHATSDAWSFCLNQLDAFWSRLKQSSAVTSAASTIPTVDWGYAATTFELPAQAAELLGKFADDARRLGQRTGELHRALGGPSSDAAFAPEPASRATFHQILTGIRNEIAVTERLLQDRHTLVAELGAAEFARDFASRAAALLDSLCSDAEPDFDFIRVHGDYHLGQVLRTRASDGSSDFQIIDFEGEPDRPISERREKRPAMKDVAGMIRSFHYASNAGAVGLIDALDGLPKSVDVAAWQQFWFACTAHCFLAGYQQTVRNQRLIPVDPVNAQRQLNVFLLEKAMYELRYELNNRPDWARIPLIGLASTLRL